MSQKKGPVLQRGLEGIPEPDGFERTRGDNRGKQTLFPINELSQGFPLVTTVKAQKVEKLMGLDPINAF